MKAPTAGVKTQFINIDGNYWQVFGLEKVMVLLTFGLAGYNLDRLRRWQIDLSIAADKKRAEQRRRRSEAQRKAKARRAA